MSLAMNSFCISAQITKRQGCRSRRHAFTLIEMVVVIGIVVLLAGIILGVAGALSRKSETDQTAAMMQLIDMALVEWETTSDRRITFGVDGQPAANARYDIQDPSPAANLEDEAEEFTHRVVHILNKSTGSKEILARIDPKRFHREENPDPALRIGFNDPWDNDVLAIFPGRKWVTGDPPADKDVDGTIRTTFEKAFGICENGSIMFVSAGPDGEFGNLHLDTSGGSLNASQLADIERASDNIYSRTPRQDRP